MNSATLCRTKRKRLSSWRCAMLRMFPVRRLSIAMTSWPSASRRSQRWLPRNPAPPVTRTRIAMALAPPHADVLPAGPAHLGGLVDVAQVDHRLRTQYAAEPREVQRPEGVPLRGEHEEVGSGGAVVGVLRVVDVGVDRFSVGHRRRVERPHG